MSFEHLGDLRADRIVIHCCATSIHTYWPLYWLLPLWDTAPRTAGAPQPRPQLCFSPAHHPLTRVFMCMSVYHFSACPPPLRQRMSAGASRVAQHPHSTQNGGAQSQRGSSMVSLHMGPHSDAPRRQVDWVCVSCHTFLCCHSSQGAGSPGAQAWCGAWHVV